MKKIVLDRWLGLATVLALAGGASVAQAAGLRSGSFPGLQAGGDMSAWRLAADDSTQAPEAGQTGASASSSSSGQEAAPADQGAGTTAAGKSAEAERKSGGVAELLEHNNYRFDIDAPSSFASTIRDSTLVGRWQHRKDYDPVQFDGLVSKLHDEVLAIVQAEGYFEPRIEIDAEAPDRVKLTLKPGNRTKVSELDIQIEGQGTQNRALANVKRRFGMAVGDPFVSSNWQSGKSALIDAMKRQGYLRARIARSTAQVDAAVAKARLTVVVDSGDRIAFGKVEVQGLSRYPEKIITDLQPFHEGDAYTDAALQTFQERLREAGYFSSVSAVPDTLALQEDPSLKAVPIRLVVEELKRHRLVYGLGYSTDDGFRGQVGFQDRSLFGLQMEASLVMSERRQRAFTNFRTPYDAEDRYYGFGGRVEREDEKGVVTFNSNAYVGYGQRERDIEAFTSLQLQQEEIHFRQSGQRDGVKALVLGKAWTLQRFDSQLNPSRGYGVKFEISGASKHALSDATFTRFYTSMVGFKPLSRNSPVWRNGTFIGRVEFGVVNAGSRFGIPSENLFRAGGIGSLRGYGYRSLGLNVNNSVIGQRYLAIGSLEYQHRITEMLSLGVFYDYGNVTDAWRSFDAVSGYGAGLQVRTPVGPVKLDLAYGQAIHRYRVHFSIGFSF